MLVLRRSSKRLPCKRYLAGFAPLAPHPLHHHWQLDGKRAYNSLVKRFPVAAEERIRYRCYALALFSPHMHEALCYKRDRRTEVLEHPVLGLSGEASLSDLVSTEDDWASVDVASSSRVASRKEWSDFEAVEGEFNRFSPLDPGKKKPCSLEDAFHVSAVAEPGTPSPRIRKLKEQGFVELADAKKLLNSGPSVTHSWKAFCQNSKKGLHSLPEHVDSRISSLSKNERRQETDNGSIDGEASTLSEKCQCKSTETKVSEPLSNVSEDIETSLHVEDGNLLLSQVASKDTLSLLGRKNKEEECNDMMIGGATSRRAASYTEKLGRGSLSCERRCFGFWWKRKMNKRNGKKNKSWNGIRQLGPKDLKHIRLGSHVNQIAAIGTSSFKEMPRVHGKELKRFRSGLPHYSTIMSSIIDQEFSWHVDSFDANVLKVEVQGKKDNSSEQEANKQVLCVKKSKEYNVSENPGLEEEVSQKFNAAKQVFGGTILTSSTHFRGNRQKRRTKIELKMHRETHAINALGKRKHCEKVESFHQNKENIIIYEDFKGKTLSDSFSKSWISAHVEILEKGVDGNQSHHAGVSKLQRPLKDSNFKDFYIILDLNGLLIKRWDVNPSLPGVSKLNKRWIQLRPGCIEFLFKAFSKFQVGIWSTMTQRNVLGVCEFLEKQAHRPLPFFMLWNKDSCYQHRGVGRPEKSHVPADFKPLSHVWRFFKPYLGSHNTVLIDDSPYKACMNNPCNCIFPYPFEGCTDDDYLNNVLWPYLEKMGMAQDIQGYIANNPLGQQPIVVGHELYSHVRQVMDVFDYHVQPCGTAKLLI